jgi:hypothetical protein
LDPTGLAARLAEDEVTVLEVVPSFLQTLLEVWEQPGDTVRLPRLIHLMLPFAVHDFSGEPEPISAARRFFESRIRTAFQIGEEPLVRADLARLAEIFSTARVARRADALLTILQRLVEKRTAGEILFEMSQTE